MHSAAIQAVINRHFPPDSHPYRKFERTIVPLVHRKATLLDIGCGRNAPVLANLRALLPGGENRLIGLDHIVSDEDMGPQIDLVRGSACNMADIKSESIDVALSRSVMEHIEDVDAFYAEVARVLMPGGRYVFLTPNLFDYVSLISWAVPNSLHSYIIQAVEGRVPDDVFPTFYRSNTKLTIRRSACRAGLSVDWIEHLGQYPATFMWSTTAFRLASLYHRALDRFGPACLKGWILGVARKV